MTTFLQKIAGETAEKLIGTKRTTPPEKLKETALFQRKPSPVLPAFKKPGTHVIAEVKFASPSAGTIYNVAPPSVETACAVADGYLAAGATMLSVLTEPTYFKGSLDYLAAIRAKHAAALLLRKEFIVDAYQLLEARAAGADAILLIVAMTDDGLTRDLYHQAKDLGLTPLVEVHDEQELTAAQAMNAEFIGVNNRNLKTLKIDLDIGRALAAKKPPGSVFICESGLSTPEDIRDMAGRGYDGFLMGSSFMRHENPGAQLQKLLAEVA